MNPWQIPDNDWSIPVDDEGGYIPWAEEIDDDVPTATIENQDSVLSGRPVYFPASTNVNWLSFDTKSNPESPILYVSFGKKNKTSVYGYNDVSVSEVLEIAYAPSVGRAIHRILKGPGRFGSLKPYFLVSVGDRPLWDRAGDDSITRHSGIPMPGREPEGFPGGYHPHTNWHGAPGLMGAEDPNNPLWKPAPQFNKANRKGGMGRIGR